MSKWKTDFSGPCVFFSRLVRECFPFPKPRVKIDLEGRLSQFCTFAYRGRSHRRKGAAARHMIDMVVSLYRSPIPVERRGYYTYFLPAFAAPRGRGGGVSTLWHFILGLFHSSRESYLNLSFANIRLLCAISSRSSLHRVSSATPLSEKQKILQQRSLPTHR